MTNLFTDDLRRDPYAMYDMLRGTSPVLRVPPPFDAFLLFDYDSVNQALTDHATFSSRVPAPRNWFIFFDPPAHTKLRGLISRAFTPRSIANLEPHMEQLSQELLDQQIHRGEMDLATDYSIPLPIKVIARMIGIPPEDWATFRRWSDAVLELSHARSGGEAAEAGLKQFMTVTAEMNDYLTHMIAQRRVEPRDDLLTRLIQAEVDGQRLTQEEVLGFFQLLLVGGQETTANLINNAILCFLENPDQFQRLKANLDLLPSAIEEVLRYRSPLQWLMRTPTREIQLHGQTLSPGKLILPMLGSANRDPKHFDNPARFDITRDPNPHLAFGHGIHFCMGAPLSRLEGRIALTHLIQRLGKIELASSEPWQPRKALHVHGPQNLPIRFTPG